jgi:hypothetical protein
LASSIDIATYSSPVEISTTNETFIAFQISSDSALDADVIVKLQQSSNSQLIDIDGTSKTIASGENTVLIETNNFTLGRLYLSVDVGSATAGTLTIDTNNKSKNIASVSDIQASEVSYDNATSGLTASDVQAAIDELDTNAVTNHSQLNLDDGTNPHGTTKSDVGLGNADNTSDLDKPVSTAQQTEIDTKEDDLGDPLVNGYVLSSTTLGVRSWVAQSGSGGGLVTTAQSINYNAVANDLVLMTTGASDKTVTLNASPTKDDIVGVSKADSGTGNVITDGNGNNINGSATTTIKKQYTTIKK